LLYEISNAELAAAFGADWLLLNMFVLNNSVFHGLPDQNQGGPIREIKKLTGRIIGVNLEAVDSGNAKLPPAGWLRWLTPGKPGN